MRNTMAILRRELGSATAHPQAWAALAVFVGLLAVLTLGVEDVLGSGVASMRRPFFWMEACLLFLVPAVTMRLLAEEHRSGTLHLLGTLPVTTAQIVVGKWLAAVALVATGLLLTLTWPIALSLHGPLDWGPVAAGYLGVLLTGSAYAAVGTLTSAVTRHQVLAFLLALVLLLAPWLLGLALPHVPGAWAPLVEVGTLQYHFDNLARGVVDTRSIVFYVAVTAAFLRGAVLALEHRRLA